MDTAGGLIAANRRRFRQHDHPGDDAMFAALRPRARQQMIEDAIRYTSAYRDVEWAKGRIASMGQAIPTVLMAGHQPTIFHPGVWFKNFALSHLGAVHGALPINLVIDNDVASSSSIRVPSVDVASGEIRRAIVAYDRAGGGVPFEQTTIEDLDTFNDFDASVVDAMGGIGHDPCITALWKHAREAVARCGVAGCALAQARHGLEADVGLRTLEMPLGVLCRGSAFAEFLLTILTDLPRFQKSYNNQTDFYRAAHGIRSSAHPVPHLESQEEGSGQWEEGSGQWLEGSGPCLDGSGQCLDGSGQWLESPLWVYGNDSPTRKPVWVKRSGDELVLSDSPGSAASLDGRSITINVSHRKLAAEQLANLVDPNFKLRPRALITTMYARLILSDLFIHGIGGGKYDQLGDRIIEDFYGVKSPEFMVISATILLPEARAERKLNKIGELKRKIRDTYYQPERFFQPEAGIDSLAEGASPRALLIAEKQRLLANAAEKSLPKKVVPKKTFRGENVSEQVSKKAWHDRVTEINAKLSLELESVRDDLRLQLMHAEKVEADEAILASREHPFCAFDLNDLVQAYRKMLA